MICHQLLMDHHEMLLGRQEGGKDHNMWRTLSRIAQYEGKLVVVGEQHGDGDGGEMKDEIEFRKINLSNKTEHSNKQSKISRSMSSSSLLSLREIRLRSRENHWSRQEMERARVREERRRRMNKTGAHRRRVREREETARQEAASEAKRCTEERHWEERKQRQKEEAMAQHHKREWCAFQRAHGVTVPETTRPSKIRLRISTPVSALSAGSPSCSEGGGDGLISDTM